MGSTWEVMRETIWVPESSYPFCLDVGGVSLQMVTLAEFHFVVWLYITHTYGISWFVVQGRPGRARGRGGAAKGRGKGRPAKGTGKGKGTPTEVGAVFSCS